MTPAEKHLIETVLNRESTTEDVCSARELVRRERDQTFIEDFRRYVNDFDVRLAQAASDKRFDRVGGYIEPVQIALRHLNTFLTLKCRICGKSVLFGYNTCVSCADERGP